MADYTKDAFDALRDLISSLEDEATSYLLADIDTNDDETPGEITTAVQDAISEIEDFCARKGN